MTIRILTRHPALRYVLGRSAPRGTTVRALATRVRPGQEALYAIEIDSPPVSRKDTPYVLGSWIPTYVGHYGAQRVEINGRPVDPRESQLRRALATPPRRRQA